MITALMTNTVVPGFHKSGEYTSFGQTYAKFTHAQLETDLDLSVHGEIACAGGNDLSTFIGAVACILDDSPDSMFAATHLKTECKLEVLKYTDKTHRNWVFRHPILRDVVLKVGGDIEENRIQFQFMNHVQRRLELHSTDLCAPKQYALLQSQSGISAIFMTHLAGQELDKCKELDIEESTTLVDIVKNELYWALNPENHVFLNDIGHNDHYANILYLPGDMLGIIDLPNMSNPLERAAIISSYRNFLS